MAISIADLNTLQSNYKASVDAWVNAIRQEEFLASSNHNEAQIDQRERAGDTENDARTQAKSAKKAYEAALRQEFFNF